MPARDNFLELLAEVNSVRHVLLKLRNRFIEMGAERMSYHLVPPLNNPLNSDVVVVHSGFDKKSIDLYSDPVFRRSDPIAQEVLRTRKMMTWQQALAGKDLTETQVAYLEKVRKFNMIDGWSIPLFGPNGRNGYCSICMNRQLTEDDFYLGSQFEKLALIGHRRICDITIGQEQQKRALSKRETDILLWMCRGKSNSDIATIYGLSAASVDTYVRRIFKKLGASSRLGATVGALSLGLVKL